MILYRIGNCDYINDLSGTGSRLYGGRWNNIGKAMVYLASSRSLALLEVLAHSSTYTTPLNMCIAEFEAPNDSVSTLDLSLLPAGWQDPSPAQRLLELGDAFLAKKDFLLMKVPSVIVPQEFNYLMNPLHPEASKVKIIRSDKFRFDDRLLH